MILIGLLASGFFLLAVWIALNNHKRLDRYLSPIHDSSLANIKTGLALTLVGMVVVAKAWAAAVYPGYPADVGTFSAWALDVYERGFSGFYRPDYFADYPPGYISVLWLVGGASGLFGIDYGTPGFLLLLKTPAMLADLAGAIFLLRLGRHDRQWRVPALLVALFWLLNPMAIITSAFWGQVDSIFTLMLVMALWKLERRQFYWAAGLYAVAILFKPQALLVAPVALVALLLLPHISQQLKTVAIFIVTFFILSLPFTIFYEPTWIFTLYASTLGSYDFFTLNAFNFYALIGQNWLPNETLFMGLRVSLWAWFITLTLLAVILGGLLASGKRLLQGRYVFAAFAVFLLFFVFGPKMHERYLYPAALIGFLAFVVTSDKRILWLAIGTSLTTFINTLVTLDIMLRMQTSLVPDNNIFLLVCSFVNVLLLIFTFRVGYDIFIRGNIRPLFVKTADELNAGSKSQ